MTVIRNHILSHGKSKLCKARSVVLSLILVTTISLFAQNALAQKQANVWHFGYSAGLDFNYTPPKSITKSSMSSAEGCASIADADGNLLFYTNGITVWNKTHNVMKNGTGLKGHKSSTQSAIIVPKPQNKNIYYIFTIDGATGKKSGAYFNEVDISKDGDKGEVTRKNIPLIKGSGSYPFEGFAATSHANHRDFWVTYLDRDSSMRTYLVNPSGVDTVPVVSKFPGVINSASSMCYYMKFSSNDSLMAVSIVKYGLALFRFNANNGKFTDVLKVTDKYYYGLEFSPNSQFLYANLGYQWDVSKYDTAKISKSEVRAFSGRGGALQLGPNQKIYCMGASSRALSVINKPNLKGAKCDYQKDSVTLTSGMRSNGLPTFVQSYVNPVHHIKGDCYGDSTRFEVTYYSEIDSIIWHFGDLSTFSVPWKDTVRHAHLYKKPGTYEVTTILKSKTRTDSIFDHVTIRDFLATGNFLGDNIIKCRTDTVEVKSDHWSFERFSWSTGDTTSSLNTNNTGTFSVKLFPQGKCYYTDTITVSNYANDIIPERLSLGQDVSICSYDSVVLKSNENFQRYQWNSGDTSSKLTVSKAGQFILRGYNHPVCYSLDTIKVNLLPDAIPNLGPDTSFCSLTQSNIRVGDLDNSFASYSWNTGSQAPFIFTDTAGQFILVVENKEGCVGTDTAKILVYQSKPSISISGTTQFCDSLPFDSFVNVKHSGGVNSVLWRDGTTELKKRITKSGMYHVTVHNACGHVQDSVEVKIQASPTIQFTSIMDTLFCDTVSVLLNPVSNSESIRYLWNTGDTTDALFITNAGLYQVNVSNSCGTDSAKTDIRLAMTPKTFKIADSTLCIPFDLLKVIPTLDTFTKTNWYRNHVKLVDSDSIRISKQGQYHYVSQNVCGSVTDSFSVHERTAPKVDLGSDKDFCDTISLILASGNMYYDDSILWSTTQITPFISVNQNGKHWVTVSNMCGVDSDTINVRLHSSSEPLIPSDTVICDQVELQLDATIAGKYNSYRWNTGETEPIKDVNNDGTYSLEISNFCGTFPYTTIVEFLKTPIQSLSDEIVFCDSTKMTTLTAGRTNNKEEYLWSTGDTTRTIQVDKAQAYSVIVSNLCGSLSDSALLLVSESPLVDLGSDTSICGELDLRLNVSNDELSCRWMPFGKQSNQINVLEYNTFSVIATNKYGCTGFDTIEVNDNCRTLFYLPTAFSPNDDGLNDIYGPKLVTNVDKFLLQIYNRWGEKIFESSQLEKGWDGSFRGERCQKGLYMVTLRYYNQELKQFVSKSTSVYLH